MLLVNSLVDLLAMKVTLRQADFLFFSVPVFHIVF